MLSIEETAFELGVSRSGVYRLLEAGDLPSAKIGRRRLIPADQLKAFLKKATGGVSK